jgi:oligoendopeptidase F
MAQKLQTNWNLKQFYKSITDPQIEKDVRAFESAQTAFAKKYRNATAYLNDEKALLKALKDYEKLVEVSTRGSKAVLYFMYIHELNSFDTKAEAMSVKLSNRLTKAGNQTLFFSIKLGEIPPTKQKRFLKSALLKDYRYLLERTFLEAQYQLSEKEEKILSLKSLPARSLWVQGREKLENKQTVRFKGKDLPLAEALNKVHTLPTKERYLLHTSAMKVLESISDFAESEVNAVFTDKKINDELRGFKKPYSGTVLGYENDEKSVEDLVLSVTKDFKTAHRFFALKRKLLGLKKLSYADRSVSIGKVTRKFSFEESYAIIRKIFYTLGDEYGNILDRFIKNGQIDAFPKRGKSGGAYCSSNSNTPTLVLLNHINSFSSLETFAHEMGHAIHAELAKSQPIRYQGHTTSVAETASTFFETVVFNTIFESLSDKEKIIALHDKIQGDIATVYRQIAFFNFELELHGKVREEGFVAKEVIAELLNKHMKTYMGSAVAFTPLDGYFFVTVSHFRNPFYVYSYAYGQLISKALYEKYKEDPTYIDKVKEFLSAGCSKSPERIFGDIGIKTDAVLFATGLKNIKNDIARLEKLTHNSK